MVLHALMGKKAEKKQDMKTMSEKSHSALIGFKGVPSQCMPKWFWLASNAQFRILQLLLRQGYGSKVYHASGH
jgi:hypothetical protein